MTASDRPLSNFSLGEFTRGAALKNGAKIYYELKYADYKNENGVPILADTGVHKRLTFFAN